MTKIEEVARAMDPWAWQRGADESEDIKLLRWCRRDVSMSQARLAIEAMREPTDEMVAVAWEKLRGNLRPDEYYKYMIDTALQEDKRDG